MACNDPDCPIRAAVIAPVVAEELVVARPRRLRPERLRRAGQGHRGGGPLGVHAGRAGRARAPAHPARWRPSCGRCGPRSARTSSTTRLAAIASFVRTDPDRARELLLEFADFTRYALRRGGAFTTLAEELRNVERYLVLEQARFGDRLQISLLIAPEVLPVAVPFLAIQPLVENAVRHGLATKEGVGHVTITATDQGSEAEIAIEDDGVGSDPERGPRGPRRRSREATRSAWATSTRGCARSTATTSASSSRPPSAPAPR